MKTFGMIILVSAVAILAVTIIPLILLVGLNYLGYNVPYTFDTWLGGILHPDLHRIVNKFES